uniref:Uncharacterized protein n=1 Tax=Cucumis melo TaxID=3656 RepID=A0A9I9DGY8_CUCME
MTARGQRLLQRRGEHALVRQRVTKKNGWCNKLHATGFVEMRQLRSELHGQTPVGADTINSIQIRTSRRRGVAWDVTARDVATWTNDEQKLDGELR